MATNVVSAVVSLCTAALKSGHALHDAVIPPSKWASEAGFPGSKASPLRAHMARESNNGCGRSGRYGPQSARGMLDLLAHADAFSAAETKAKQETERRRVRQALDKSRQAQSRGAKAGKATAKRSSRRKAAASSEA